LWVIVGVAGVTFTMVNNSMQRIAIAIDLPGLVEQINGGPVLPPLPEETPIP